MTTITSPRSRSSDWMRSGRPVSTVVLTVYADNSRDRQAGWGQNTSVSARAEVPMRVTSIRLFHLTALALARASLIAALNAQAPQSPAPPVPTFDVVSIKRNTTGAPSVTMNPTPGGDITLVNGTMRTLITQAY